MFEMSNLLLLFNGGVNLEGHFAECVDETSVVPYNKEQTRDAANPGITINCEVLRAQVGASCFKTGQSFFWNNFELSELLLEG